MTIWFLLLLSVPLSLSYLALAGASPSFFASYCRRKKLGLPARGSSERAEGTTTWTLAPVIRKSQLLHIIFTCLNLARLLPTPDMETRGHSRSHVSSPLQQLPHNTQSIGLSKAHNVSRLRRTRPVLRPEQIPNQPISDLKVALIVENISHLHTRSVLSSGMIILFASSALIQVSVLFGMWGLD